MTIPKLTPYTGQVANPDGSQTQSEFTQNMFNQLSYEAQLATELDATIDGMNQAVTDVGNNANAASASAIAAEAAANFEGEFTPGATSAEKGKSYLYDGEIWLCLQNTTTTPSQGVSEWKLSIGEKYVAGYVTESQGDILGGKLFKGSDGETVENGDVVEPGTTHLRVLVGGKPSIVAMPPIASGVVSSLSETGATIGGVSVNFSLASSHAIKLATGIFSLKDIIGVNNGDDITEEIKAINANEAITAVFIPSDVSFTSNVGLQKDSYGNGTLTYRMNNIGGRENTLSRAVSEGVAAMKRCEDFGLTPTQKCAFTKVGDRYFAYRHLGGALWLEMQYVDGGLDGSGRPTRWNWYDTYVRQYNTTSVAGDSNVTKTGTFTDFNSNDSSPYVGHRSTRSQAVGGVIDIEVTSGGDYYVVVVGQVYGNYMKVEIDGSYELVNELPDDVGYPYVDCYSATEPDYRKRVLIASNVPSGSHTVTLTHMSDSNPSKDPLLDRMWWNAIEISSEESSVPWSDSVRPKQWSDGITFSAYDECIGPNGNFYVTSSGGTSGSTPPTHTSGTVSDGGINWLSISSSAFETKNTKLQPTPAQVDYAYEIIPSGQSNPQDVGGNAHGNEYLTSDPELYADGVIATLPSAGEFVVARSIVFRQKIRAYYTLTSSEIDLNDTILNYEIDKNGKTISHTMNWLHDSSIGYFYPAMWTLYRYTGGNDRYNIFDTCYRPIGDNITLQDYIGQSNPIVGGTRDVYAELRGRIFRGKGSGNTSSDDGELSVRAGLLVTSESVNDYKNTEFSFGMATNNSSFDGTNKYAGWTSKMYFQRCSTVDYAKESVSSGDSWNSESRYCVSVG